MHDAVLAFLSRPAVLLGWVVIALTCTATVILDLWRNNAGLGGLMKAVWALTVLYSGPLGLAIYWATGRRQISRDSLWRRGWRSTAHCYAGCGMGEIVGLMLTVGILSLGTTPTALVTFGFAFVFGLILTIGPLMADGVALPIAAKDAVISETLSIAVMEIVAIGVDLWLSAQVSFADPLFWTSMVFSLTAGLLAAWPVNVALVAAGVKEGMMDPRKMDAAGTD
jgi:hypothetical protein